MRSRYFSRFPNGKFKSRELWVGGLVRQLREWAKLPDFGEPLGYDGKAEDRHSTGRAIAKASDARVQAKVWSASDLRRGSATIL